MTQLSFGNEEHKEGAEKVKTKGNILSVRLSKEEVAERDALKMNDKDFFHYKMKQQQSTPVLITDSPIAAPTDVATIRKQLELEYKNKQLEQQLQQLQSQNEKGLSGLGNLIAAEMEKYKHDQEFNKLKEDNQKFQSDIKQLETELEEAENDRDELYKKVQMLELVKEVGPHLARAVKGFHEKGIGGALGELSNSINGIDESAASLPEHNEHADKIRFAERFINLFPETNRQQQVMTLLAEMSAIPWLADKVQEYINALKQTQQTT